jgi:hypothetical protein
LALSRGELKTVKAIVLGNRMTACFGGKKNIIRLYLEGAACAPLCRSCAYSPAKAFFA